MKTKIFSVFAVLGLITYFSWSASPPTIPGGSNARAVTVDTNGTLSSPTNFFALNIIGGSGVTVTPVGSKIVLTATGAGGGGGEVPTTSAGLAALLEDETGSGALLFATGGAISSPTITTPTFAGAITFPAGTRQTFSPNSSLPGVNVGAVSADPASSSNGDLWANSVNGKIRARISGQSTDIANGYQFDFNTATISSATSIAIDLSAAQYQTCNLGHNTVLSTANRPTGAGRSVTALFRASGATRTITLSASWINYGSTNLLTIADGKEAFVTILALGANETDVRVTSGTSQ